MQIPDDVGRLLDNASRYVITKTESGVTVGLHLGDGRYGEASSPSGNVAEAVWQAYDRAVTAARRVHSALAAACAVATAALGA